MINIIHFFCMLLIIVLFSIYFLTDKKKYLIIMLVMLVFFLYISFLDFKNITDINEKMNFEINNAEVLAVNDNVQYISTWQINNAVYEKSILKSFNWNTTELDILSNDNLLLLEDVFSSVLIGIIQNSYSYDFFSNEDDFVMKLGKNYQEYIGKYCGYTMDLESRQLCSNTDILGKFPQKDGYVVLMDKGVFADSENINVMTLVYTKNDNAEAMLKHMRQSKINSCGIYIGTMNEDGKLYYVFVDFLHG